MSGVDARTIAEYDWCDVILRPCSCDDTDDDCSCVDEQLHAPSAAANAEFVDWDGDIVDGETACGIRGRLTIPGVFSRLGCPRCGVCCERLGYPVGDGSPKNDDRCREILWPA